MKYNCIFARTIPVKKGESHSKSGFIFFHFNNQHHVHRKTIPNGTRTRIGP